MFKVNYNKPGVHNPHNKYKYFNPVTLSSSYNTHLPGSSACKGLCKRLAPPQPGAFTQLLTQCFSSDKVGFSLEESKRIRTGFPLSLCPSCDVLSSLSLPPSWRRARTPSESQPASHAKRRLLRCMENS